MSNLFILNLKLDLSLEFFISFFGLFCWKLGIAQTFPIFLFDHFLFRSNLSFKLLSPSLGSLLGFSHSYLSSCFLSTDGLLFHLDFDFGFFLNSRSPQSSLLFSNLSLNSRSPKSLFLFSSINSSSSFDSRSPQFILSHKPRCSNFSLYSWSPHNIVKLNSIEIPIYDVLFTWNIGHIFFDIEN